MLGQKAETYDDERWIAPPSDVTNCGQRSTRTLTLVTHITPNPGRNRAAGVAPRCLTKIGQVIQKLGSGSGA